MEAQKDAAPPAMNIPSAPPDGVVEVDGPPPLEVKLESAPSNTERPDGAPPPTEGAPVGGAAAADDDDDGDEFGMDPEEMARLREFAPNKHLVRDGGTHETSDISNDWRDVDECAIYGLMGSGASPEELMRIAAELEASYEGGPPPPPKPYEAAVMEEYVPDRCEIDPVPPSIREMMGENYAWPPGLGAVPKPKPKKYDG